MSTLVDGKILVRPLVADDAAAMHGAVRSSLAAVGRWLSWCHPGYCLADAQQWIAICQTNWATDEDTEFGIFDAHTGEFLGGVGINQLNHVNNFANLGYWVRSSCACQGVATTAARLVGEFGFEQRRLSRLEIVALVENMPSRRVAEKLGARFEGIARQRVIHAGEPGDAAIYGLVPGDLDVRHAPGPAASPAPAA